MRFYRASGAAVLGLALMAGLGHAQHHGGHTSRAVRHTPPPHRTAHPGMRAPAPAKPHVPARPQSRRVNSHPPSRSQPSRTASRPSNLNQPKHTARPSTRPLSRANGATASRPSPRPAPTSRQPAAGHVQGRNLAAAVPSQRGRGPNPSRGSTTPRAAFGLFDVGGVSIGGGGVSVKSGGELGAIGNSVGNFVSNPGKAISNSPVGKTVSNAAQQAGKGLSNGASAIAKGAGSLPSLGNASTSFGGGSGVMGKPRLPTRPPSPGEIGKQLGKAAPGIPTAPVIGKGHLPNPLPPLPSVPAPVIAGGKHVLNQGVGIFNQGLGTLGQVWGRGPVMADPTPPGWNVKPFPHATLGSNGRIPFDYSFGPYQGQVMIPTRGHIFGQHHVGFNPYYEIGMRNQTAGDLVIDAVGFMVGADFPLSPFANVAADTLGPWINWAGSEFAEWAAHTINDRGH